MHVVVCCEAARVARAEAPHEGLSLLVLIQLKYLNFIILNSLSHPLMRVQAIVAYPAREGSI